MNRIIKFRCWNPLMKEMLDDHYLKCHNMTYAFSSFNLEHLNFMQFTGLLDKNGKEIYEGDVCFFKGKNRVWIYGDGCFGFEGVNNPFVHQCQFNVNWHEMEIIGNIYENTELLNT